MATRRDHGAYVPPAGERAAERHKLSLKRQCRTWNGHWEIEGDMLHVCSAYGSRTEAIGKRKDLRARAEALFADILDSSTST